LRLAENASIIQENLLHFEGMRYHLAAWCIMPNHVHVVMQPMGENALKSILHSWKSYTANAINNRMQLQGALWEREAADHILRCSDHIAYFTNYINNNPVAAGLAKTPEAWPFSSAGIGFKSSIQEFIDPKNTPFANMTSRGELPHLAKEGGTYFLTWRLLDAVILKHKQKVKG